MQGIFVETGESCNAVNTRSAVIISVRSELVIDAYKTAWSEF